MRNEVYNVPNITGLLIDAYPYNGTLTKSQDKEIRFKGVGLTLYGADVEVDKEDGCLYIGLTKQQAITLAEILSKIVFKS